MRFLPIQGYDYYGHQELVWCPQIQVFYEHMKGWWAMPIPNSMHILSEMEIYDYHVHYEWDYGPDGKKGTVWKDEVQTTISRYELVFHNFQSGTQRNVDTRKERPFQIVWVALPDMQAFQSCVMS